MRKGDVVKVFNGEYKKKTGKIAEVDMRKLKVLIDGIYKSKKDGTKIKVYFHPSNLMIQELNLDDKKRLDAINRKGTIKKKMEKKESEKEKVEKKKIQVKKLPKEKTKLLKKV